ncbi:MAG: enoyl-CoA hydratase/isomerase family protein [Gammaproteobacteria bacterium]|nr:enoyl-CoA hydratase/isomerase family protein [Gammaproteobacteria bacterium]
MAKQKYQHWRLENDQQGIAWLHFDKHDSSTNVLSSEVFEEFDIILSHLPDTNPKGLIILSDKQNGFIAGANVNEFTAIETKEQALALIQFGQSIFDKLEALPFPTLSQIHGFCLGGGLELALACRYRIALDDPKTRIGLPEVLLGFHPGWGGTMRLVRLIGAPAAMDLMLSGRTVDARTAKKLGIVDRIVPQRHLNNASRILIGKHPKKHKPGKLIMLANHRFARPQLAKYLRSQVNQHARRDHYPAPYALINLWEKYSGDEREMLRAEANSVAELVTTPAAKNLVRVFLLQERLKSLGHASEFEPRHVHVIGAGVMGGDIAAWCALRGLSVTLQDREPKYIAPALKRAGSLYKKKLKDPRLIQAAQDRLIPDHKGLGVEKADVIIEAIIENLDAKQSLYNQIEPKLKDNAVLATNTSSIPLDALSKSLARPGRLVGIHFFNPVAKMQLIEIVQGEKTDKVILDQAAAFCRTIDRLPLPVKSSPGFLVNRILMPYLMEAVLLLEEGVSAQEIDRAATTFGMPMGPIELADTVGLDICLSVAKILAEALDMTIPDQLRKMVAAGHLGRKSGRGFYEYHNGKPRYNRKNATSLTAADVTDRLILQMINEAMACLREGVVADTDLLDAGMIFATGFAPFRGGPMHYMEQRGRQEVKDQLLKLKEKHGDRFSPDAGWN